MVRRSPSERYSRRRKSRLRLQRRRLHPGKYWIL